VSREVVVLKSVQNAFPLLPQGRNTFSEYVVLYGYRGFRIIAMSEAVNPDVIFHAESLYACVIYPHKHFHAYFQSPPPAPMKIQDFD